MIPIFNNFPSSFFDRTGRVSRGIRHVSYSGNGSSGSRVGSGGRFMNWSMGRWYGFSTSSSRRDDHSFSKSGPFKFVFSLSERSSSSWRDLGHGQRPRNYLRIRRLNGI